MQKQNPCVFSVHVPSRRSCIPGRRRPDRKEDGWDAGMRARKAVTESGMGQFAGHKEGEGVGSVLLASRRRDWRWGKGGGAHRAT